jgi:pimeloyl-ACP methyl ester carboxylesterase
MEQMPAILYLHGLGASPESKKASLVRERLSPRGFEVRIPDLNAPSLSQLSVLEALRRVEYELRQLRQRPVVVIGSSFGGFLALRSVSRLDLQPRSFVRGVALLGAVVDPWDPTSRLVTPEVERQWCQQGSFPIVRSDEGRPISVHYRFVEELRGVTSAPLELELPMLIVHGMRDAVVPYAQSVRLSEQCPRSQLVLLDEEHQLLEQPTLFLDPLEGFCCACLGSGGCVRAPAGVV